MSASRVSPVSVLPIRPAGRPCVAFTTAVAQRLVAEPGKYDAINLVAAPGVSQAELVRRLSPVLPAGTEAITGKAITAESQSQIRKSLSFFNTFLLIFAVVAVLVGGFMMFNTFSITVAQRTRENGLLRALGASRRQMLDLGPSGGRRGRPHRLDARHRGGLAVAVGLKNLLIAIGIDIPSAGPGARRQALS